jgi:uncharacterized membrane protein YraQ (UPF0718 family)/copper chaperone CopZ
MAPYLILGFLIAGVLHVFIPEGKINKLMGKKNTRGAFNASVFGIPLPLCSCGVLPTGISFYKNGASKGSTVSFMISTPQTGVDSILVTYSMLGLPFAVIRPVVAFLTGIMGGFVTNQTTRNEIEPENAVAGNTQRRRIKNPVKEMIGYAFYDFLKDIAQWMIIGLLLAALISVVIPDNFFESYLRSDFLGMLAILLVSIPLYVCATSSIPIAAVLMLKGLSPGAALVFLMAGPATNAATITVISQTMGRRSLFSYMATIIGGALIFGVLIDYLLPASWFTGALQQFHDHEHDVLPYWLKVASAIFLTGAIVNIYIQKYWKKLRPQKKFSNVKPVYMNQHKVEVKGMTCSHCKANVENSMGKIEGIKDIRADIDLNEVTFSGEQVDYEKVKQAVEEIGYQYGGKK